MTIDDLRIQAQLLSSLQIDSATAYKWVTDEIESIAAEFFRAGTYTREEFETTEKFEEYTPVRAAVLIDKIINQESRRNVRDWDIHNGIITMSVPGKYELRYYAYPEKPQTVSDDIEMPRPYILPIKFYLAARIRARLFGQNDSNAVSFMTEYNEKMKQADITADMKRNRHNRMPPGRRDI